MQGLIILHGRDTIGITYGYGSIEVLERAGVHEIARHPVDLLSLLH